MNDDHLDPLLDALRCPARAGELGGESDAVESMMSALTTTIVQEAPTMFRRSPHRIRVAAVVAAGVIGFAGVAAAGPGGFARIAPTESVSQLDEDVEELEDQPVEGADDSENGEEGTTGDDEGGTTGDDQGGATGDDEDGTTGDGDGEADDTGATDGAEDAEPDTELEDAEDPADDDADVDGEDEADDGADPKVCEGYANHGERVSEAATSVPGGPHKGEIIRAIATDRDCSEILEDLLHPDGGEAGDVTEDDTTADDTTADDGTGDDGTEDDGTEEATEAVEAERGNRPDHAGPPAERPDRVDSSDGSRSNGNGNGNGNGRPENPGRPDRD